MIIRRVWDGLFVEKTVGGAVPWLIFGRILSLTLGFVTTVLIARALGPFGKGITSAVILLSSFVVAFSNLGIGQGVFFYQSRKEVKPAESFTTLTLFGVTAAIALILLGSGPLRKILVLIAGEVPLPYLIAGLLFGGLNLLGIFYSDFLRSLGLAHLTSMMVPAIQLLTLITVGAVVITGGGLPGIVGAFLLSSLFTIGLSVLVLGRLGALGFNFSPSIFLKSFRFGRSLYLNGLVLLVHTRFNQMLVISWFNPSALGQLGVAMALAEMLWLIDLPLIGAAQYHIASRSRDASIALVNQMTRLIVTAQFCACAFIALCGPALIVAAYGKAFHPAVLPLLFYLPGIFLWSVGRSVSQYIGFHLGRNDINLYIQIIAVAVNIAASLMLVKHLGIGGATLATSLSYGLMTVILLAYYKYRTGVSFVEILFVRLDDFRTVVIPQWHRLLSFFGPAHERIN